MLEKYIDELEKKESSVPFILSRMNIDISKALTKDKSVLNDTQENILKKVSSTSHIRYGY